MVISRAPGKLRVAAGMTVAALLGVLAPAPSLAADAPTAELYISPAVASPNGDGYDDEVYMSVCQDAPGTVDITIASTTGTVVRTFTSDIERPEGCDGWTWDATDETSQPVPEGDYVVAAVVTMGDVVVREEAPAVIDLRVPGSMTAPVSGPVAGPLNFAFTATDGFQIDEVEFVLAGSDANDELCRVSGTPDAANTAWSAMLDAPECGHGALLALADVSWTDRFGKGHSYRTSGVEVVVPASNTVRITTPSQWFSPDGNGNDDVIGVGYCALFDPADGPVRVVADVLNETGLTIARALDMERLPDTTCSGWYGNGDWFYWDGRDATGELAPEGDYEIVITVSPPAGTAATDRRAVRLDLGLPGQITAPTAGTAVNGPFTVTFTPSERHNITELSWRLNGNESDCDFAEGLLVDGVWTGSLDASACTTHLVRLGALATWTDSFGSEHFYWASEVGLTTDNPPAPPTVDLSGPQVVSPNDDGNDDRVTMWLCIHDEVVGSELDVDLAVRTAEGALVGSFSSQDQDGPGSALTSGCSSFDWAPLDAEGAPLPQGDYNISVLVTAPWSGLTATAEWPFSVDNALPGTVAEPANGYLDNPGVLAFTPTDGVAVTGVGFEVYGNGSCFGSATADSLGVWQAEIDLTDCAGGRAWVSTTVHWTDRYGAPHWYNAPSFEVLIGPADANLFVWPRVISPNGDGSDDQAHISLCLYDPANVSTDASLRLVGGDGSALTLFDGLPAAGSASYPWYGCGTQVTWDGRDAEGSDVPDGRYTLEAVVGGEAGTTASDSMDVVIDRRVPARIVAPEPSAVVDGPVDVVVEASDGFDVTAVSVWVAAPYCTGSSAELERRSDDTTWVASVDWAIDCPSLNRTAEHDLVVGVEWTDVFDSRHNYQKRTSFRPVIAPEASVVVPSRVFSPNMDGEEDSLSIGSCLIDATDGGDSSVTATVLDGNGVHRTFDPVLVPPSTYCSDWYGDATTVATWDGKDTDGSALSDGDYTVRITAEDPTGAVASAEQVVTIDRRVPGVLVQPASGATIAGALQFDLAPTSGVDVSQMTFGLHPATGSPCETRSITSRDLDGHFRAPLDTLAAGCGDGPRDARARVWWIDKYGGWHETLTTPVQVNLVNPANAPTAATGVSGLRVFSPDGDANDETVRFSYCAVDAVGGGDLSYVLRVRSSAGTIVRTLVDGKKAPNLSCYSAGYFVTWDGKDEGGTTLPDGQYTADLVVTDPNGLVATASSPSVIIDTRPVGEVTAPASGAELSGNVPVAFVPSGAFPVYRTEFALYAGDTYTCGVTVSAANASGVFEGQLESDICGAGQRTLRARVYWTDQFGGNHYFEAPGVPVHLAERAPILSLSASPQVLALTGPTTEETIRVQYCVQDDPAAGDVDVELEVRNSAGVKVRGLASGGHTPLPLCQPWYGSHASQWDGKDSNGQPVPDGDYSLVLRATDPGGKDAVSTVELGVTRIVPATLTAPAADAVLTGTPDLTLTGTTAVNVTQVRATISTGSKSTSTTLSSPAQGGPWTLPLKLDGLLSGPATVWWYVTWTDQFGLQHTYRDSLDVVLDTVTPTLKLSDQSLSGVAPFAAGFTVTTGESHGEPVTVSVRWGDGAPVENHVVMAPYAPITLTHNYSGVGTYSGSVTATSQSGGVNQTAFAVRTYSRPPSNSPPSVLVSTSPVQGSAPLGTTTTVDASDPDGDPMTYQVDFGDGTPKATGTLPVGPLNHTYDTGGVYLVRTVVSDGRNPGVIRLTNVSVADNEPLSANAGDDQTVTVGQSVRLDGSGSRPVVGITGFSWDFGDGGTADVANATHQYQTPGTYTATLTVSRGGETNEDTAVVVVTNPPPAEEALRVRVRSTSGSFVGGADLAVLLADGSRITALSDPDGWARLPNVPDGYATVYAMKAGFLPGQVSALVEAGSGEATIALTPGEAVTAELTTEPLTYEEIVDLGIDPNDPDNQNVVSFSVNLGLDGTSHTISGYGGWGASGSGSLVGGCPSIDGVNAICPAPDRVCYEAGGAHFCGTIAVVDDIPQMTFLVLPGTSSWLKEFFRVKLVVLNMATDPVNIVTNGTARLNLPSEGLSLAPISTPQALTAPLADIPAGESRSIDWYVRGDTEGDYPLTADYVGSMQPTGTVLRVSAVTTEPLRVWGASALSMEIEADEEAYADWFGSYLPYHVTVHLKNVSDRPAYSVNLALSEEGTENFIYAPEQDLELSTPELAPGATLTKELTLVPTVSGSLDIASSFVAWSSGVGLSDPTISTSPNEITPDNAPEFTVRRGDGKALLLWEPVEGVPDRAEYRIYSTSDPSTPFGDEIQTFTVVTPETDGQGNLRAIVPDLPNSEDRWFAIVRSTPVGSVMTHPMVGVIGSTVHRPGVHVEFGSLNGTAQSCGEEEMGVTFEAVDAFGIDLMTYRVGTGSEVPTPVGGDTSYKSELVQVKIPVVGSVTVSVRATNLAGDESETLTYKLDRGCPVDDVVVLASGFQTDLTDEDTRPQASRDCPDSGRDGFNNAWATNDCPAGPDYGAAGSDDNIVGWLESQGFDAGSDRGDGKRTILEFSYRDKLSSNPTNVMCHMAGGPVFEPGRYDKEDTWWEIGANVSRHDSGTAKAYLDSLIEYEDCWKKTYGRTLKFTLVGHSLGGYEVLGVAFEAAVRGRGDLISAVVTVDGAIQPYYIPARIQLGRCLETNLIARPVDLVYGVSVGIELEAFNMVAANDRETETTGTMIDAIQAGGTKVATITNAGDMCLPEVATRNVSADHNLRFEVSTPDAASGMWHHSALLHGHTAPVDQPGFLLRSFLGSCILDARPCRLVTDATGTTQGAAGTLQGSAGAAAREGSPQLARAAAAAPDPGEIRGRVVDPAGIPVSGASVHVLGAEGSKDVAVDESGVFVASDLPVGDYRLHVTPFVGGMTGRWVGSSGDLDDAAVYSVDAPVDVGDITGTPLATVAVSLEGPSGPLVDGTALLLDAHHNEVAAERANEFGQARLIVEPGQYRLVTGSPATQVREQELTVDGSMAVTVTMAPAAVVTANALDAEGEAMPGVFVSLMTRGTNKVLHSGFTNTDGIFRFHGLDEGYYDVRFDEVLERFEMPQNLATVNALIGDIASGTAVLDISSPPTFNTTAPPATLPAGKPVSYDFAPAEGTASYEVTAGTLPPGLSLAPDGTLTGTPTTSGSFTFTVTATSGGQTAEREYSIVVEQGNARPEPSAGGPYSVGEGGSVTLDASGTTDADQDPLTYSWDVNGDGTHGDATGPNPSVTWVQLQGLGVSDGPATFQATVEVSDGNGSPVQSPGTSLSVTNVAPTGAISGPQDATVEAPVSLSFTATDPSSVDQAADFDYVIDWGDSTATQVTSASPLTRSHTYSTTGAYNVTMTATDKDDGTSTSVSRTVTVSGTTLVTDAGDVCGSGTALLVAGTSGADVITVTPGKNTQSLTVTVNGTIKGTFSPTGRIIVDSAGGDDTITIGSKLTLPAHIYGGMGDDTITGGNGAGIQVGGVGDDRLTAGNGRDILVGGPGADTLKAGNGDDVLIAGTTTYDAVTPDNQMSWCAIQSEWTRADATYASRVSHLSGAAPGGLNGDDLLSASGSGTTLTGDASRDGLTGSKGQDWYLLNTAGPSADTSDATASETRTDLP